MDNEEMDSREFQDQPNLTDSGSAIKSSTVQASSTSTATSTGTSTFVTKLDKLQPFNSIRETMDWIIGRSRRKAADISKESARLAVNNPPTTINNPGILPSGQLTACPSSSANKTGVVSFSQTNSAKLTRKVTHQNSVDTCVADSLDDTMLDKMCSIPVGMDRNEWLATQTLAMFDHVSALCGTVSDICTPISCTIMSYPGNSKASWVDERGKRHHFSAMRYIDSVMSFCEGSRKNQALFPTKYGARFSPDFESTCRRMTRLLWYCLGHLYSKHFDQITALNLRSQYGLVLAHMTRMAKIFSLLDTKELQAISQTLQAIRPSSTGSSSTATTTTSPNGATSTNPPTSTTAQPRPTKRLNTDSVGPQEENCVGGCNTTVNMSPTTRWSQQMIRIPSMKSGKIRLH